MARPATPRPGKPPGSPSSPDGDDEAGQMICCVTSRAAAKEEEGKKKEARAHARDAQRTEDPEKAQHKQHSAESRVESLCGGHESNTQRSLTAGLFLEGFWREGGGGGTVSIQERQGRRQRTRGEDRGREERTWEEQEEKERRAKRNLVGFFLWVNFLNPGTKFRHSPLEEWTAYTLGIPPLFSGWWSATL